MESYNLTIKDLSANGYNLGPGESIQVALMTGESTGLVNENSLNECHNFHRFIPKKKNLDV